MSFLVVSGGQVIESFPLFIDAWLFVILTQKITCCIVSEEEVLEVNPTLTN